MNIELTQSTQMTSNVIGWFFLIASWIVPTFFKQNKVKGYVLGISFAVVAIAFFMVALGISISVLMMR